MRDRLRRLLLRLMPWYDPETAAREDADALGAIRDAEGRRDRLIDSYREASRRYGRIGGR